MACQHNASRNGGDYQCRSGNGPQHDGAFAQRSRTLNFNTNKTKRFRELYGPDAVIDEFYTDSKFDQPMIDMARHAFMVKGNTITQVK